jgi:hypothetical protein
MPPWCRDADGMLRSLSRSQGLTCRRHDDLAGGRGPGGRRFNSVSPTTSPGNAKRLPGLRASSPFPLGSGRSTRLNPPPSGISFGPSRGGTAHEPRTAGPHTGPRARFAARPRRSPGEGHGGGNRSGAGVEIAAFLIRSVALVSFGWQVFTWRHAQRFDVRVRIEPQLIEVTSAGTRSRS